MWNKSARLVFKKIESEDLEFIHKGLSDTKLTKYYGVHFDTLEETKEQMEWYKMLVNEKKGIWWKAQELKSGDSIGAVGFNDWDHQKNKAEIGCWVLPEYWGKGFGTELMNVAIEYGFQEMGLEIIEGFIDSKNEEIKKVLKKLNFEHFNTENEIDQKNGLLISAGHFQLVKN